MIAAIGGGFYYFKKSTKDTRIPLKLGVFQEKIKRMLPKEVVPGLEWFDITFNGNKLIQISYRLTKYTAEEFRKLEAYLVLPARTGRRVCNSNLTQVLNLGGKLEITYIGRNSVEISKINIDKSLCKNLKNKRRGRKT